MGVDAKIYIKVKPDAVFTRMGELGWWLGETMGADNFPEYATRNLEYITISKVEGCLVEECGFTHEVETFYRYWDEGYARGPMLRICDIFEAIIRFDDALAVGYGNDHDSAVIEINSLDDVADWRRRYLEHGKHSYKAYFGTAPFGCTRCVKPLVYHGGGGGNDVHGCGACGAKFCGGKQIDDDWFGSGKDWASGEANSYQKIAAEFAIKDQQE